MSTQDSRSGGAGSRSQVEVKSADRKRLRQTHSNSGGGVPGLRMQSVLAEMKVWRQEADRVIQERQRLNVQKERLVATIPVKDKLPTLSTEDDLTAPLMQFLAALLSVVGKSGRGHAALVGAQVGESSDDCETNAAKELAQVRQEQVQQKRKPKRYGEPLKRLRVKIEAARARLKELEEQAYRAGFESLGGLRSSLALSDKAAQSAGRRRPMPKSLQGGQRGKKSK